MLNRLASAARRRLLSPFRIFSFLYLQRVKGFRPPTGPQLDRETTTWLAQELRQTSLFVEFGSGGSTLMADRLAVPTISVESDPYYAAAVRRVLSHPESTEILALDMGITGEWGMPMFFSKKKGLRYVKAPFERLGSKSPGLTLVDGRYRVACALETAAHAARVGRPSKMLVDDYAGRPAYHVLEHYLGSPDRIGRAAMFMIGTHDIPDQAIREYSTDAR
jgi:hypothetical protein